MYIRHRDYDSSAKIKREIFTLILLFIAGLFAGIILGIKDNVFCSISFLSHISEISFFLCFCSQMIPVLIVIVAILVSLDFVAYSLLFFCALCRGYCGTIILSVLRSSAWLIRLLMFFPGIVSGVFIIWLLIKHCNGKQKSFLKDCFFILFLLFFSSAINKFGFSILYNSLIKFL